NLKDFLSTRFVRRVDNGVVKFGYDIRPQKFGLFTVFYPPYFLGEIKRNRSMRGIPVEHAIWIGLLLSRLTDEQVRDGFRAACYDKATMEVYVKAIRARIGQMTQLSAS